MLGIVDDTEEKSQKDYVVTSSKLDAIQLLKLHPVVELSDFFACVVI